MGPFESKSKTKAPSPRKVTIVSQPSKCLKFMTFREGCFGIHVEYRYLSETL